MTETAARRLESYVLGAWQTGSGAGKPLAHAATGKTIALIGSDGLNFADALAYGREKGGSALRAITIHERALMLKAIGTALMERRQEFYVENSWTGATRRDGWVDIEGGIGTLMTESGWAVFDGSIEIPANADRVRVAVTNVLPGGSEYSVRLVESVDPPPPLDDTDASAGMGKRRPGQGAGCAVPSPVTGSELVWSAWLVGIALTRRRASPTEFRRP